MIHLFTLDNQFIQTTEEGFNTDDFTGIIYVGNLDNWQEKYYMKDSNFHREDGPAVECVSGEKVYYIDGIFLRKE